MKYKLYFSRLFLTSKCHCFHKHTVTGWQQSKNAYTSLQWNLFYYCL